MEEGKEKLDYLVSLCLKRCDFPFTFSKATIEKCNYYGTNDFELEVLFHDFNGTKQAHRSRIYNLYGMDSQITFIDNGMPGASINYDNIKISDKTVRNLATAAYFDSKLENYRKKNSK